MILLILCAGLHADEETSPEYAVKAAFLGHFGRFVTWPGTAFDNDEAPFCIGVLGEDRFGEVLDAIENKPIQGRRVVVRRLRGAKDGAACHIVFVSRSERRRNAAILQELGKTPTLTIGETEGFAGAGGVMGFYLEGGKVRFEINPAAAQRKKLVVHPKLLKLGRIVEEETE